MRAKITALAQKKNGADLTEGTLTTNEIGRPMKIQPICINSLDALVQEANIVDISEAEVRKMTFRSRFAAGICKIIRRTMTKNKEELVKLRNQKGINARTKRANFNRLFQQSPIKE